MGAEAEAFAGKGAGAVGAVGDPVGKYTERDDERDQRVQRFFAELKRRHVFKVAAVYGAAAFAVMQAADFLVPALRLPDAVSTVIAPIAILGLPVVLALAWAFELTPEGVASAMPP